MTDVSWNAHNPVLHKEPLTSPNNSMITIPDSDSETSYVEDTTSPGGTSYPTFHNICVETKLVIQCNEDDDRVYKNTSQKSAFVFKTITHTTTPLTPTPTSNSGSAHKNSMQSTVATTEQIKDLQELASSSTCISTIPKRLAAVESKLAEVMGKEYNRALKILASDLCVILLLVLLEDSNIKNSMPKHIQPSQLLHYITHPPTQRAGSNLQLDIEDYNKVRKHVSNRLKQLEIPSGFLSHLIKIKGGRNVDQHFINPPSNSKFKLEVALVDNSSNVDTSQLADFDTKTPINKFTVLSNIMEHCVRTNDDPVFGNYKPCINKIFRPIILALNRPKSFTGSPALASPQELQSVSVPILTLGQLKDVLGLQSVHNDSGTIQTLKEYLTDSSEENFEDLPE